MASPIENLSERKCQPCEGGVAPLDQSRINELLEQSNGWQQFDKEIAKSFSFRNYYETIAFVNAIAWISHSENHHPDLEVGYRKCRVRYSTHAIDGLSENDFICAAKIDQLNA